MSAPVPYPSNRAEIEESYHTPLRRVGLRVLARLMEWATDLQSATWTRVTDVIPFGDQRIAAISVDGARKFFRLKKP